MTGTYGGNLVRVLGDEPASVLADDAYRYERRVLQDGAPLVIDGFASAFVYVLAADGSATVRADGIEQALRPGDGVQLEGDPLKVASSGGTARLLVVGLAGASSDAGGPVLQRREEVHRVTKPWGHELWLTGRHAGYSLKEIFLTAGSRTSLQYHREKRETNLLVDGNARLVYRANDGVAIDDVAAADLDSTELRPESVMDVFPNTLHRLEAVTDLTLYEASTDHLDDVVRVQDDARRPDGTIAEEHGAS